MIGLASYPALASFQIVQELHPANGQVTVLAKSKQGSLVVIRVLLEGVVPDDVAAALGREASAQAKLGHDAVVKTRAVILEPDLAAIVSELVRGISLQRLVRFATARNVRLPDDAAWFVIERVLSALVAAHEVGLVHGAISPSSVVVAWDGAVKVGDFGLARMRAASGKIVTVTDDAPIVAPEQTRGARATAESDLFCAALVATRLATGRTPYARFGRSSSERTLAMAEADLVPLATSRADLPSALRDAITRATDRDPSRRGSVKDLLAAVQASFDPERGREALTKLLERWRSDLERTLPSWERTSFTSEAPPPDVAEGILALATADERPSEASLVASDTDADSALAPTEANVSMSRLGAVAEDALAMPLPAAKITMPPVPVYGGPVTYAPRPKEKRFRGPLAATVVFVVFFFLIGGAGLLFWWLLRPAQ